jgi:hypothetical protein
MPAEACVNWNDAPFTMTTAVRVSSEAFALAVSESGPSPCPLAGETCSHATLLPAFQAQSRNVEICRVVCVWFGGIALIPFSVTPQRVESGPASSLTPE